MTPRGFGPSPRQKAVTERRRWQRALGDSEDGEASRLRGPCALCGTEHAFPDVRETCPKCGREVCYRPCQCWREDKL